jgi:hypothetical protein
MISPQLHAKTPDLTRGEDWRERGACVSVTVDPEWFFTKENGKATPDNARAKRICREECPVIDACFAHYMANPDHYAVGGGMTPDERRLYARRLRRRAS